MTKTQIYAAKLDKDGNPILDQNGDKVMELVSETDNGVTEVLAPNWLGVEQSLRYSSAFSRRKEADPNDFSIFLSTLINGKAGDASEAALAYAFGILGIVWTEPEMALINKILKDNNFSIQLK